MLKPNAIRVSMHQKTAEMIEAFKQKGGVIQNFSSGVAGGLKKKKYLGSRKKVA